ncbi:MAG: AbrB/MazE/SpoVT family DNA-binding domain-containing protein [Euryarchaeota archaeon]|nr:AbrB/MazE/SpoVT family DNA-binding domain-containing protein [Euryarchaeota archaeon]
MGLIDSKGRVTLPQELRERIGLSPGTEVEISAQGERVVIEPERDPEEIEARMDELLGDLERTTGEEGPVDQLASEHRDLVRKQAEPDE